MRLTMLVAGALALVALLAPAVAPAEETCANSNLRVGYAALLPDCRAYELVTPHGTEPDFESVDPSPTNVAVGREMPGEARGVAAALDGEKLAYTSNFAPPGSPSDGSYYMASRGANGWSTQDLIPPQSPDYGLVCYSVYAVAFSPELSNAVLADGFGYQEGTSIPCGTDEPALVPGEPRGYQNLFLRDNEAASYRLIDQTPAGVAPHNAWFQSASEDLSHVVFTENAELTPEAPPGNEDLYEWSEGTLRFLTILPNGTPVAGQLADGVVQGAFFPNSPTFTHAVSADGSRVFFTAEGNLYVRENADQEQSPLSGSTCTEPAKACTVQVDASQAGGPGGGGTFVGASVDGAKVFFTDNASVELTSDTLAGSGQNLYQYEVQSGRLTDLTPVVHAEVEGFSGASEDGAYVYTVAEGALTGSETNSQGATAEAGKPNLYVLHAGTTKFIATLNPGEDSPDWESLHLTARVSPNGEYIGFNSIDRLTGYDNTDVGSGNPDQEIFLYEAAQNELRCVSCDPSGVPPTAPAGILTPDHDWAGGPGLAVLAPAYLQRNVLNDGRVLFQTAESLVPQDTNGQYDVYEYEDGELHLISTATSTVGAYFYEASPSGDDIFFNAAQQLPAGNPEASYSTYDARVDGGFPEPANLTECSEEDCKGAFSAAPFFSAPSSATFVGQGNPVATPVAKKAPKSAPKKPKKKNKKNKKKKKSSKKRPTRGSRR
jgi:hypothetical protein